MFLLLFLRESFSTFVFTGILLGLRSNRLRTWYLTHRITRPEFSMILFPFQHHFAVHLTLTRHTFIAFMLYPIHHIHLTPRYLLPHKPSCTTCEYTTQKRPPKLTADNKQNMLNVIITINVTVQHDVFVVVS